jgi:hypothetical protein
MNRYLTAGSIPGGFLFYKLFYKVFVNPRIKLYNNIAEFPLTTKPKSL